MIDGGECCIAEPLYFDVIVPVMDGGIEAAARRPPPRVGNKGDEHGMTALNAMMETEAKTIMNSVCFGLPRFPS